MRPPYVGETDPLVAVLIEELVANGPVRCFVLVPVGVHLLYDLGGSWSAMLFIAHLGCISEVVPILQLPPSVVADG
jgi:hypothetical protein